MQLETYDRKCNELQDTLKKLAELARELRLEGQEKQACQAIDMLKQEQFHMVVVGEFSRGKSTFVNALLGQQILPVSKSPTTAIISKIVYGDKPEFILHYKNGKSPKMVSLEEFSGLKAPKEGILNSLKDKLQRMQISHGQEQLDAIEYASVKYPLAFCKEQVELVDTPGTNDLNTGCIEITYRYLDQADALIMLLAADQALSKSEAEFLKERILKKKIQDVFFIINRKDALNGVEEEQQVLNFVSSNLKELLPDDMKTELRLFLVSSKQALLYRRAEAGDSLTTKQRMNKPDNMEVTGFVEFEQVLGRFLSEEKGQAKLQKYIRIGKEIQTGIREALALRKEISAHSVDEIKAKAAAMEPEFLEIKHRSAKIIGMLRSSLEAAENEMENACVLAGDRLRKAANEAVDNYSGEMEAKKIKEAVERAITPEQKRWIDDMQKQQQELVAREISKAEQSLRLIWSDLQDICYTGNPGISVESDKITFELENVKERKVSNGETFAGSWCVGSALGLLLGTHVLLPALALGAIGAGFLGLFDDSREDIRAKVKVQLAEQYNQQAERIKDKVLQCYQSQVREVCEEMQSTIDNRIHDMQNQLQCVLQEKEMQENDAKQQMKNLALQMASAEDYGRQLIALTQ